MVEWTGRHRILTWALAWGVAQVGFVTADVFSSPRQGPLWVAVVFGLAAWSVAGAVTLHPTQLLRGVVVWATAFVIAFWLGAIWGNWFENTGSAGFVGALFGWAVGGAFGAFVSGYFGESRRRLGSIRVAAAWGLNFFVAGYISVVAGMVLAQAAKDVLAFLGSQRAALTIGWGLGAALGGALASAVGFAAWERNIGPSSEVVS